MTDKQIIIDVCPYQGECSVSGCKRNDDGCFVRQLFEERNRAENQIVDLNKMVEAKERECKNNETAHQMELDIYNQACLDLQEELKAKEQECEAYKMEAEEGKEINAELKAENDNLKSLIWWIHIGAEGADKATTEYYENRNTPYEENYWKRIRALQPLTYESKYKLVLTEIKEIATHCMKQDICATCHNSEKCYIEDEEIPTYDVCNLILQKISEVIDDKNS